MVNSDWLTPLGRDESLSIITELALAHAAKGGEQGKRIASCITGRDFLALCNFSLDYEASSTWELSNCRQALAFFSKLEFIDLGVDRRAAAVETWWEAEHLCKETNDFFEALESGRISIDPDVAAVIHRATRKISLVLGDVPSFSQLGYRFGPGATTLVKKSLASVVEKLQAGISCSEELLPYASRILAELPHLCTEAANSTYARDDLKKVIKNVVYVDASDSVQVAAVPIYVEPDRVSFVPKNAKTYRSVTTSSGLTMMVQLAFGDHMSDRLAAFGINLRDQTTNQEWAQVGSIDGSIATVDLSSASDTIATRLVYHLFPYEWALALNACRCSQVELDGEVVSMEKFASMGNGYTFPLESLIFWALASSCSEDGYASVYGDDTIVPTEAVPLLLKTFLVCGFKVNTAKSYWTGSFRESCGADYHSGIDIRPYYQKDLISGAELFKLHNFYERCNNQEMRLRVKAWIHPDHCIYGPDNYGDGHLVGAFEPLFHKKRDSHGYGGATFDTFKHVARRDRRALRKGDSILPLYSAYRRETGDEYIEHFGTKQGLIAYLRINRFSVQHYAPLPMPERTSEVDGSVIKTPTFPGTDGYKKVSIYTFEY